MFGGVQGIGKSGIMALVCLSRTPLSYDIIKLIIDQVCHDQSSKRQLSWWGTSNCDREKRAKLLGVGKLAYIGYDPSYFIFFILTDEKELLELSLQMKFESVYSEFFFKDIFASIMGCMS